MKSQSWSIEDIFNKIETLLKKHCRGLQITTGTATASNGSIANTALFHFGDNVIGITKSELQKIAAEFCDIIEYKNTRLLGSIREVFVSETVKTIVKELQEVSTKIHEGQIDLSDILGAHINEVKNRVQTVLKECQSLDEQVSELKTVTEDIQADIRRTYGICEEILTQIRWGNEHIGELATLVKKNSEGIESIDDKVEALKEIVLSYIQLAERHHEESQLMLTLQNERSSSPGLDEQTILTMRVWFDKISHDISEKSISTKEIIGSIENRGAVLKGELTKVQDNLYEIRKLIDQYGSASGKQLEELKKQLSQKAQETLQRQAELYSLALDIKQNVDEIKWMIIQTQEAIRKSPMSEDEKAKWQERLQRMAAEKDEEKDEMEARYRVQIFDLQEALKIERSSGAERDERACPWCGYYDERKIIGDECVCGICGHRFSVKDIDPNMHDRWLTPEQEQEMISRWKENHTAVLEKVSENKYRMRIPSRVGDDGILIIPSETKYPKPGGEAVKQIDFCQPNTDDEEGRKQLLKVKKLFLDKGIKIGEFHEVVPFSEIDKLEKVMKWDGRSGFIEDKGTLKKIKGEVANDA